MTTPRPPLDDAALEREWQAQEVALHAERDRETGSMRGYRPLIRALRQPVPELLADDFAARMELLATAERGVLDRQGRRFQRSLLIATAGFLLLALGGISAVYGKFWVTPVMDLMQSTASHSRWLLVLLAAAAFSIGTNFWRRAGFSRR